MIMLTLGFFEYTISLKMTAEIPSWMIKTAQARENQLKVQAEKNEKNRLAAEKRARLKDETVNKLVHQVCTNKNIWHALEISSLVHDIHEVIYPQLKINPETVNISYLSKYGILIRTIFFRYTDNDGGASYLYSTLRKKVPLRVGSNHLDFQSITQSISDKEGSTEKNVFSLRLQGRRVFIELDNSEFHKLDQQQLPRRYEINSESAESLRTSMDEFISKNFF